MSEYLLSVIGIVFISALLSAVTPDGKTASVIKGATRLCCLVVILSPIVNFFVKKGGEEEKIFSVFSKESVIQTDESFIDYCSKIRIENAQTLLTKEIDERYGVEIDAKIEWSYQGEEIKIERILLQFTSGENESLQEEIVREISLKYGSKVEIYEEMGIG